MTVWAVHYFAHHRPTEFLVCTAGEIKDSAHALNKVKQGSRIDDQTLNADEDTRPRVS
jgi:hypothetical protein